MKKWMIGFGVTAVSALAAVACSSSSSTSPSSPMDSGSPEDATTETDTGTTPPEDSGTTTAADTGTPPVADAGDASTTTTLYARLAGHAGIRGAIHAIVGAELADTEIKSYFFNQVMTPVPAGHPTADQIEECFTDLLAKNAGGTEAYPTVVSLDDAGATVTVADASADGGGFACRGDMAAIHAPLKISGGTFDKFIMIAGGVLTTAMGTGSYTYTSADITTIANLLVSTKGAITDANLADAGAQAFPGPDAQ
jgi:hypothetical protein